ncbi:MAG TPA: 1,4-alpha-glucan branching protein GlgB, partial [Bacillota bacterium]|nr:1,4-alpha-glucan branching protein GlgB [Bacillota bacterium]
MRVPTDYDLYLFREGTHTRAYEFLGSSAMSGPQGPSARFAVWAPNTKAVYVAGDFNGWDAKVSPLNHVRDKNGGFSGIWAGTVEGAREKDAYKYLIEWEGGSHLKSDPFAFSSELRPATASIVTDRSKVLGPALRPGLKKAPYFELPLNVYEAHLGTWMRHPDGSFMSYGELADRMAPYLKEMSYTHAELMPLNEHPLDQSWGYQATGLYSPTSRHGDPQGLKYFIETMHNKGIGVILDWVPAHFCKDSHGLDDFDGTKLFGRLEHPDWGTMEFDLSRPEVRSFLISNAVYWLREYGFDGLRIDAVASMLYLDYSRKPGEWEPNIRGGRENLDAVAFLRQLNDSVEKEASGSLMIAEESTAWPKVSWPTAEGGLGFKHKWNMGWMNDFLRYMKEDPIHRRHHHDLITFAMWYNYSEKFILPLSHDEVVHGKGSLIGKMPGDYW